VSVRISVSWPELGVTVGAALADEQSPELCAELVRHLPFSILQSHPVVSGSSVTMWLPYLSTAPTPALESILDAPIGRIRLSQTTGSKLSIQYGKGLEPAKQAVLGQIDEDGLAVLPRVGREVWDNLFWRKDVLTVRFALEEEPDAAPTPPPAPGHPLARELAEAADGIQVEEPEDVARLHAGDVPDAGSFDQYFSVWVAGYGLVRDYVVNTLYPVYDALPARGLETVRAVYATVGATYHSPLRYHGFRRLADFADRFRALLDESDDEHAVGEVLAQLLRYGNATYAWAHQMFPWYLGMHLPARGTLPPGGRWRPS
jgi:Cucumopine synthase C-terminal helical bundle domain